jgi:hypothetical protein
MLTLAILSSIVISFTHHSPHQILITIQLFFLYIYRFVMIFQYVVFVIHVTEIYPVQVRGLGVGIAITIGGIGGTITPIVLEEL